MKKKKLKNDLILLKFTTKNVVQAEPLRWGECRFEGYWKIEKFQVNMSSRMESNSEPSRTQISEAANTLLLKEYPEYETELRGEIPIKVCGTKQAIRPCHTVSQSFRAKVCAKRIGFSASREHRLTFTSLRQLKGCIVFFST